MGDRKTMNDVFEQLGAAVEDVARDQAAEQYDRLRDDYMRTVLFAVLCDGDASDRDKLATVCDELAITAAQCIQVKHGPVQELRAFGAGCFLAAAMAATTDAPWPQVNGDVITTLYEVGTTMGYVIEVDLDDEEDDDTDD